MDYLPPEMQAELERVKRQRAIAQALAQGAVQQPQGQMVSGIYVRPSRASQIGRALTGGLGFLGDQMGASREAEIGQQGQTASREELARVLALPLKERIAAAQQSRFPQVQKMAPDWQKQQTEQITQFGKLAEGAGDFNSAFGAITRQEIPQQWRDPGVPPPQFAKDPSGNPYAIAPNRKGEGGVTYAPQPSRTDIRLPGKEGELAYTREDKELTERQTQAKNAMSELATAQRITEMLEAGAQAGGGETIKQIARQTAQFFGVEIPETGLTDSLSKLLGERVLDRAKELGANPSNADREVIRQIAGSIDSDPTALSRLVAYMTGTSLKSLQDYQDFVGVKRKNSANASLYDTAEIGIRSPEQLFGPQNLQMQMVKALQQVGGDITRLKDPSGQPFAPNSAFEMSPLKMGPEGAADQAPPPGVDPAKWQRYIELKRKYGGKP